MTDLNLASRGADFAPRSTPLRALHVPGPGAIQTIAGQPVVLPRRPWVRHVATSLLRERDAGRSMGRTVPTQLKEMAEG